MGEDEDKEFRSLSHGLPFRTNMFVGVLEVAGCLGNGRVPFADGFKCEEVILWCHPLCQIRYNDEAYSVSQELLQI